MSFSPIRLKAVQMKKPPSLAVFLKFGLALLLARLPLFHRLEAGTAKVEIKVKARESHGFYGS
jgi:hypothetical protein